jgi:hypothetical protein
MAARRRQLILDKYPELGNQGYAIPGAGAMAAAPQSALGKFLETERGALGLRFGDFVPGVSNVLAARDVQELGLEAEQARKEGNSFGEYTSRALQGVAGLGAIPFLGMATTPVVKAGKQGARRISDLVQGFGEKWGPREGFYSKAERVLDEKLQGRQSVGAIVKLLRGAGVKEAEIRNLDLERLAAEMGDRKLTPEEVGNWVKNRRPRYTERVLAGDEPSAVEPYDEDELRDLARDQARDSEAESASEYINDISDYEEVTDDDGELLGWRVLRDGEEVDPGDLGFDVDTEATGNIIPADEYSADAFRRRYDRWIDSQIDNEYESRMEDFDADDWIDNAYGGMEDYARQMGRYNEDYGEVGESFASRQGLDIEKEGKWPGWTVRSRAGQMGGDEMENYVELVQQTKPTGWTLRRALIDEMADLDDQKRALLREFDGNEELARQTAPGRFAAIDDGLAMRQRLLDSTEAAKDTQYTTHWDEISNPVQHVRGLYNQMEAERLPRNKLDTPEDALMAGYGYEVGPTNWSRGMGIRVTDPAGNVINERSMPNSVDPNTAPMSRYAANQHNEQQALSYLLEQARRKEQNQAPQETGLRGFYAQELQADIEQQARSHREDYGMEFWPATRRTRANTPERQVEDLEMLRQQYPDAIVGTATRTDPYASSLNNFQDVQPMLGGAYPDWLEEAHQAFNRNRYETIPVRSRGGEILTELSPTQGTTRAHPMVTAAFERQIQSPEWNAYLDSMTPIERQRVERDMQIYRAEVGSDYGNFGAGQRLAEHAERAGVPAAARMITPEITTEPAVLRPGGNDYPSWPTNMAADLVERRHQFERGAATGDLFDTNNETWRLGLGFYDENGEVDPADINTFFAQTGTGWNPPPREQPPERLGYGTPGQILERQGSRAYPEMPLMADEYNLATKRALLEAAATDQDFLAWPYADTQLIMNQGRSATLFPNLYGLESGGGAGQVGKNVRKLTGLSPQELALAHPDQPRPDSWIANDILDRAPGVNLDIGSKYRGATHPVRGVYLDEKTKKKILEQGLPFYMIPPAFVGLLGLSFLGTGEEARYD